MLRAPRADINIGLHGYNGILVGCALPSFFGPTLVMWVLVAAGAFFSTVIMMAVSRFMQNLESVGHDRPFRVHHLVHHAGGL